MNSPNPTPESAVAAAIRASEAEVNTILADDFEAFAASLAPEVVVNSPLNAINRRDGTLGAFKNGFISYSSFERNIEYAGTLGSLVVTMGSEVINPKGKAPNAGRRVHRRFTDIWRMDESGWRLILRQATVIKVE